MKKLLLILAVLLSAYIQAQDCKDTIITKSGRIIVCSIGMKTDNFVYYEIVKQEVIKQYGIKKDSVERIFECAKVKVSTNKTKPTKVIEMDRGYTTPKYIEVPVGELSFELDENLIKIELFNKGTFCKEIKDYNITSNQNIYWNTSSEKIKTSEGYMLKISERKNPNNYAITSDFYYKSKTLSSGAVVGIVCGASILVLAAILPSIIIMSMSY